MVKSTFLDLIGKVEAGMAEALARDGFRGLDVTCRADSQKWTVSGSSDETVSGAVGWLMGKNLMALDEANGPAIVRDEEIGETFAYLVSGGAK